MKTRLSPPLFLSIGDKDLFSAKILLEKLVSDRKIPTLKQSQPKHFSIVAITDLARADKSYPPSKPKRIFGVIAKQYSVNKP